MDEWPCAKEHGWVDMKPAFERFVTGIVRQTDCNLEEREDLYEELLTHLECSFIDYRKKGYSEEEAIRTAMTNFGTEQEVGDQLQAAMYPYRKGMMLGLSIASLLFAYSVYASQLFIMGDAHILWLILAVLIGMAVLFVTVHPVTSLNRRLWMNGLLLVHLFVYFYGLLLATDVLPPYSVGLTIIAVLILLLAIILIYRTTIYDYPSKHQAFRKDAKRLHFINITLGILAVFVTLFFLWAFLLFSEGLSSVLLWLLIPIGLWMLSYAVQMRLLANQKGTWAYAIVSIQIAAVVAIIFWVRGY